MPLRAHALRLLLGVVLLGLHVGAARGDDDAHRGMRFTSAMQVRWEGEAGTARERLARCARGRRCTRDHAALSDGDGSTALTA